MEVSGVRKRGHPRKSWFDGCRKKLWIHKATQTHCYNPVAPAYLIWAYYAHGRQRRCQEDPVGLPSSRLEKTTGSSPHHMAQHHPTGSETSPSYAPRSSRFGSELPSVEDDVDVWRYSVVSCMPETTTTTIREVRMCRVVGHNGNEPTHANFFQVSVSLGLSFFCRGDKAIGCTIYTDITLMRMILVPRCVSFITFL